MDTSEVNHMVKQLAAGFDSLQEGYMKLHGHHQALERKLATAREQYNEISKLYGTGQTSTPPLSLSSSPGHQREDALGSASVVDILRLRNDWGSKESADKISAAVEAANLLRNGLPHSTDGVKIWSGPLADRQEGSSCMMPSITESPLEQDFTVEGKPSKLGCPFASMAKKKLSSHAASVLSRYNQSGSGAHGSVAASSTHLSAPSRINGMETLSRRQSRRTSFADPIKAEICGLSNHGTPDEDADKAVEGPTATAENAAEVGVCPIRFLDQHSPEEVATYFEKHKHELPRNHEVCVMRYQSNEAQIRELDAKYGNIVSMIQGLGQKHKDMLPADPDDGIDDGLSDAKVRKWASSVSAQAPEAGVEDEEEEEVDEERQPHFERPLRDIRVGESPSRPWGIPVPVKYLEKAQSDTSSKPAQIAGPATPDVPREQPEPKEPTQRPAGKCPFDHGAAGGSKNPHKPAIVDSSPLDPEPRPTASPVQRNPAPEPESRAHVFPSAQSDSKHRDSPMVFTGPVFIGYSAEDAAKILSGLRMNQ